MNKTYNKLSKNMINKIDCLIDDSGMSKEDFIKSLNEAYSSDNNSVNDFDIYCDSFTA